MHPSRWKTGHHVPFRHAAAIAVIGWGILIATPASARVVAVTVPVKGMTCALCTRSVEESIRVLGRIAAVEADLSAAAVRVEAEDGAGLSIGRVRDRVKKAGFEVDGECEATALGAFTLGPERRITFTISGVGTVYQLLEGHQFMLLVKKHEDLSGEFRLSFRLHEHPYWNPPGISVTGFEKIASGATAEGS